MFTSTNRWCALPRHSTFPALICLMLGFSPAVSGAPLQAPSSYSAYTGTDPRPIPSAPALGPANSVINDPTFGSRILRVTDQNTGGGASFISTDAGFHRTWNADSTAIKLTGEAGDGYWLEFDPSSFTVGAVPHPVPFGKDWEWSTVDPNIIYYLNGSQLARYSKATGATENLAGTPNGDPVRYKAVVIGSDNWVCSAAGEGIQDTFTKLFCVNPVSPGTSKFIDVYNRTIDGVPQGDPNWPTSAPGQTIGIHSISGGTGASWLEITFHRGDWGGNGGAVFNLGTNTWSLIRDPNHGGDPYWSGHESMGNGRYVNGSGSQDTLDSRALLVRDPDNLMNSSAYLFIAEPRPPMPVNHWCDAEHNSWFNSLTNPNAPILVSRYNPCDSSQFAWTGEIIAAAVDGSNTVWRFAHNHNGGCYFGQGFAQISNDGRWALFSSFWGGTLGQPSGFGCGARIDTFIVELQPGGSGGSSHLLTVGRNGTGTGTVTSSPSGIDCGGACSASFPQNTQVSLTASPDGGSTFAGWGGECSGTGSCNVTMDSAKNVTATFDTTGGGGGDYIRVEQDDGSVGYSGSWFPINNVVLSGGTAVEAMNAGSIATFTFNGTSARWIGFKDQWSGIARVYVDGVLQAEIDTYDPENLPQQIIYTTPPLSSGTHTLSIEVTETRNGASSGYWVWVDAFEYVP